MSKLHSNKNTVNFPKLALELDLLSKNTALDFLLGVNQHIWTSSSKGTGTGTGNSSLVVMGVVVPEIENDEEVESKMIGDGVRNLISALKKVLTMAKVSSFHLYLIFIKIWVLPARQKPPELDTKNPNAKYWGLKIEAQESKTVYSKKIKFDTTWTVAQAIEKILEKIPEMDPRKDYVLITDDRKTILKKEKKMSEYSQLAGEKTGLILEVEDIGWEAQRSATLKFIIQLEKSLEIFPTRGRLYSSFTSFYSQNAQLFLGTAIPSSFHSYFTAFVMRMQHDIKSQVFQESIALKRIVVELSSSLKMLSLYPSDTSKDLAPVLQVVYF
jgi:hypothetical protein